MTATVACIDVGQGDCTVAVDHETGEGLLIDCRIGHHGEALREFDYLGLAELRAAIVSHTQLDHFGGVLDVLEALADRFTGTLHFNHDSFMATPVAGPDRKIAGQKLRALLHRAREYDNRVRRAEADVPDQAAGTIVARLLAPTYAEIVEAVGVDDPNRASAIVLLKVGSHSMIIGGDAPLPTWERVADQLPQACVVRWPHHGGGIGPKADAHERLQAILVPSVVIVSVGATNKHGHPTPAFFTAVGGRPGKLLCTQATAACVAGGRAVGTCAGTIRIQFDESALPTVVPDTANHPAFVASLGNAQCLSQS